MNQSTTNEAEIRTLLDNWAQAVRAENIDAAVSAHSNDMLLFDVPLPVQSHGIDNYRKSWELFFDSVPRPIVFDVSELRITAGDDVAFAHGLIHCEADANGQLEDLAIRLTVGLRKVNSKWSVTHEHHSQAAS